MNYSLEQQEELLHIMYQCYFWIFKLHNLLVSTPYYIKSRRQLLYFG